MNISEHSACKGLYIHQCGTQVCTYGHTYGPGLRDHFLIHCIFDGKGVFKTGGKSYALGKNQGFLILPGTVASYAADSKEPWHYGWAGFGGEDASAALKLCGMDFERPVFAFQNTQKVKESIERMSDCYSREGSWFRTTAELFYLFSLLDQPERRRAVRNTAFDRAVDFINKNYSYPITVEEISEYCGVSRSQLFRIFKAATGLSVQEYLIQLRLETAVGMMRDTDLTVTEVLYSCGFNDPCHFSRQFKKKYGITPSQSLYYSRKIK